MAVRYSLPTIVTDGLVLYLDAGNKESYPGTGTAWNDISRTGNNGTLINGPTFDTGSGGSVVFDGVNDYVDCGNNSSLHFINNDPYTLCVFTRIVNFTGQYPSWFDRESFFGGRRDGYLLLYTIEGQTADNVLISAERWASTVSGATKVIPRSLIQNNWTYLSVTYDGSTLRLYINGELQSQSAATGTMINTSESLKLAHPGFGNYNNCKIATVNVYNRALSAEELTRNYNTLKKRFDL